MPIDVSHRSPGKYCVMTPALMRLTWLGLLLSFLYSHRSESRPVAVPQSASSSEELIKAGTRALTGKDYRRAAEAFEAAFLQDYRPVILCHLGRLADSQGRQVAARDLFQRCLSEVPASFSPELQEIAQSVLSRAAAPAGSISFLSPKGGFLWIDESLTARLPANGRLVLPVAAGKHTLRILLQGAASPQSTEIDIKPDERLNARCEESGISILSPFSVLLILQDEAGAPWQSQDQVQRVWQAIEPAIGQESGALIPFARAQQLDTKAAKTLSCRDQPACQIALGQQAGATHVLAIKTQPSPLVSPSAPADYRLSSTLLDTRVELPSDTEQASCMGCGEGALLLRLAEIAKRTFLAGLRPIGWLEVRTPRAEVTVDGGLRRPTPFRHAVFLGSHTLTISRPYFEQVVALVKVEQEETTAFDPPLVPLPLSRGERAVHVGRWVFGGVGLAMMAIGTGLVLQGDSLLLPTNPDEYLVRTSSQIPGIALLAGGGAAVGISIALFAADAYYSKRRR